MPLSRRALLGLEAVVDVAIHARPDPVQMRDITQRQGVPQRHLEQIMQTLVRANILRGVRGPRGGYRLARERRRITLGDIIAALDTPYNNAKLEPRSQIGHKALAPLCCELQIMVQQKLANTNLEDICHQMQTDQTPRNDDFTI